MKSVKGFDKKCLFLVPISTEIRFIHIGIQSNLFLYEWYVSSLPIHYQRPTKMYLWKTHSSGSSINQCKQSDEKKNVLQGNICRKPANRSAYMYVSIS